MSDNKKIIEKRRYKRFKVKNGAVAIKSVFGEIIDISMGGMAFSYIDRGDGFGEAIGSCMLFGDDDLSLDDLPFKIISDHAIGNGLSAVRRCGVQFDKLTPKQVSQLEYFIRVNRMGEVAGSFSA